MSSTVVASGIPLEVSDSQIEEFFSFCGKTKSIEPVEKGDKTKAVKVEFVNASAVSTALLLNGAELGGGNIKVVEEGLSKQPVVPASGYVGTQSADSSSAGSATTDIAQEDKPKSTILAEYLANGYVLSDGLVQKAVEFDQKNGISSNFKQFLGNLDSKYHIQDKNQQLYQQANSQLGLDDKFARGRTKLDTYFDKFKNDKYGSRIHRFYTDVTSDAKQVHEEAKRLAEFKKAGHESNITPESSTVKLASNVPLEEPKK
ncbi:hypothetical protein OGAPHI_006088 [Ogataea philodendri]|uniref:RRM domain-containing protein n=1 Tax=Ogataea philodendri TaxID=1378263 RepID=A0A9P8T184_9ASCO|nr:uncharacterized protein OGAPHI_006088 [Ogataea philodendri]KAH3661909.1 hypothetical protein OGAPHI_006088 [Ogataea philodendri]